jgi:hypothetical protein
MRALGGDMGDSNTGVNGVGCDDVVGFNCTFDDLSGDWQNITPKLGWNWCFNDS